MRYKNIIFKLFASVIFFLITSNLSYAEVIKFSNCKFINDESGKRFNKLLNKSRDQKVIYNEKEALQKKNSKYDYIEISFDTQTKIFTFDTKRKNKNKKILKDNFEILDERNISFLHLKEWEIMDPTTNKIYEKGLSYHLYLIDLYDSTITQFTYGGDQKYLVYIQECQSNYSPETGETNDIASSGTAFFINNRGNLLTNNHVVEGCKLSKISYFNKEHDAQLISTDKTLDLALLKVDLKPRAFISFSNDGPKKRQQIIIAGYPLGQGLSDDLKINDGRISSLKGFENNSNEITVDVAINPGNSGGPIINQKGQLVAIAVAGMSKDVTEGINFGIKASAAENFLKSNNINPSVGIQKFSMDDDKLVKLLEESTVYTFCN